MKLIDAAVGEVAGRRDLLGDRADEVLRGDHRRVVGAGDGDVDLPGDQAAVLVVQRDGEALDLGLAGGQILDGGIRNRVGPGQLAAGTGAGGVAVLDRRERAEDATRPECRSADTRCTSVRSTSVKLIDAAVGEVARPA